MHAIKFSHEEIKCCFDVTLPSSSIPTDAHMCHIHYYRIYNFLNHTSCESCSSTIPQSKSKRRAAAIITNRGFHYLNEIYNASLNSDSIICNACYMMVYNYDKLDASLSVIEKQLSDFKENPCNQTDVPPIYLIETYLFFIKLCKENRGILLQDLYSYYCNGVDAHFRDGDAQECVTAKRNPRWLLVSILSQFGKLVEVHLMKCEDGKTNHNIGNNAYIQKH